MSSLTPPETYGTLGLSGKFMSDSEIWDTMCDDATNVIPLVIPYQSNRAFAWNATGITRFREGRIPRIYMSLLMTTKDVKRLGKLGILSNARDIFGHKTAKSSLISLKESRALVCGSCSNRT